MRRSPLRGAYADRLERVDAGRASSHPLAPSALLAATAVARTLDILNALLLGGVAGRTPVAGLGVHFALMAVIAAACLLVAAALPALRRLWIAAGTLWDVLAYLAMYRLVIPVRFGVHPRTDAWSVGNALFSHIVCVGLPIAFIPSRRLERRSVRSPGT